jgi:hypothetical protein
MVLKPALIFLGKSGAIKMRNGSFKICFTFLVLTKKSNKRSQGKMITFAPLIELRF